MKPIFFLVILGLVTKANCQSNQSTYPLEVGIGIADLSGKQAVVLDPIHVKAAVFRQGAEQFALIQVDVTSLPNEIIHSTREKAAAKTGIPYSNISLAATHTHMAKAHKDITSTVIEAISKAKTAMKPVKLKSGIAQQFNVSFNRRYFMKDGSVVFNPMFLNPDIVRPAGTIDPEVGLVFFTDPISANPVSVLINFALHLDIVKEYGAVYQNTGAGSPNAVSADYPYWIDEALKKDFGQEFASVFLTGACGNINHWDFSKPGPQSGHKTKAKQVGDSIYNSIERALPGLKEEVPSLATRSRIIEIPLQTYSEEDLAWANALESDKISNRSEEPDERKKFLDFNKKRRILWLDEQKQKGNSNAIPLDVQVFRLTDNTAIVTLPGEMFVEFGLTIKNHSPFENTIIIELANNSIAYVPNKKAFSQGGYEVENSRIAPGGGEMLVEAAIEMLKELKEDVR